MRSLIIKTAAVVLLVSIFSIAIHALLPEANLVEESNFSWLAKTISFPVLATLFFVFTYFTIAIIYIKFHKYLPGKSYAKPLIFGNLVALIWWVGMIEAMFILESSLLDEFIMGFLDYLPIVILVLLLDKFIVKNERTFVESFHWFNYGLIGFILVFTFGRFLRYIIDVNYDFLANPLGITIWTLCFGLVIALNMSYVAQSSIRYTRPFHVLIMTIIFFGLHYAWFVYFLPIMFIGYFIEMTIILVYEIAIVTVSTYFMIYINNKNKTTKS